MGWKDLGWINLAQDSDKWWAVVKTLMSLWFPLNAGISWVAEDLIGFQKRTQLYVWLLYQKPALNIVTSF
jgi:hypothetical protein